MKNQFIQGAFIMTLSTLATSSIHGETVDIKMDKGSLTIEMADLTTPYQLSYEMPQDCLAELEVKEVANSIELSHRGDECPKGALVKLLIRSTASLDVQLTTGVITLNHMRALLKEVKSLDASVRAGTVITSTPKIKTSPCCTFAGAEGSFKSDSNEKGVSYKLRLGAGLIQL